MMRHLKMLGTVLGVLLFTVAVAGCAGSGAAGHDFAMASLSEMPAEIRDAPVAVSESYQFAVANPEILEGVECYCGCGAMGHTSNLSCYVQEGTAEAGDLVLDGHALGCTICVDITQDTMRLMQEGKTVEEIQAYVDQRYSEFGPPTP